MTKSWLHPSSLCSARLRVHPFSFAIEVEAVHLYQGSLLVAYAPDVGSYATANRGSRYLSASTNSAPSLLPRYSCPASFGWTLSSLMYFDLLASVK
jgi:hypothetical protein